MNKFYELYQSTKDFHTRFNSNQDLITTWDIFFEEYNECVEHTDLANLKEEIVDLIVTSFKLFEMIYNPESSIKQAFTAFFSMARCISDVALIAQKNGVKVEDLEVIFDKVIAKNNAKTTETHYLNPVTGKITRRSNQVVTNES